MLWGPKPTIDSDDEEWQFETWRWLLENLGGVDALHSFGTKFPTHEDFPKSGLMGHEHVLHVFEQVAAAMNVDTAGFDLAPQESGVDPVIGPLAVVQNAPRSPVGTYQPSANRHLVTYDPAHARDLEGLIATLAHEICHPLLLSIPAPPPGGGDAEEFATDLAMVFFGFGVFGGNGAFKFSQFRDDATGTQGWSTERLGYLSQNEWGFALAVRTILRDEDTVGIKKFAVDGLWLNYIKNLRYLRKYPELVEGLT